MTPNDIILKAKELIERDGWVQGSLRWTHDGVCQGRCLVGALRDASMLEISFPAPEYSARYNSYLAARQRVRDLAWNDEVVWNDTPGRTKDEVLEMLTKAAQ